MKMNYLLKSSNFEDRQKNARKKVAVTAGILILAGSIIAFTPVRNIFFLFSEPLWKLESSIAGSSFFEYFKAKQTLINERQAMEQKLFLAGDLLAVNENLKTENDNLKDLLGRKDPKDKTVLATILVKPPQTPYDMLTLDIGTDHNVKVGDKVIANGNVYIGEISEVLPKMSKAFLYSSPGRKLSVVLGAGSVTAEAVGIGGGNFNILLPREVEVKEGDVIVIPAINSNVFGIVEQVNFKDKDSFQTVLFKSPVNVSELSFVEVII